MCAVTLSCCVALVLHRHQAEGIYVRSQISLQTSQMSVIAFICLR